MLFSLAFERTELAVRPSFSPMTLVGVFCLARFRSWETSVFDQSLPVFLVDLGILISLLTRLLNCSRDGTQLFPFYFWQFHKFTLKHIYKLILAQSTNGNID
jgi:hypothetical protein